MVDALALTAKLGAGPHGKVILVVERLNIEIHGFVENVGHPDQIAPHIQNNGTSMRHGFSFGSDEDVAPVIAFIIPSWEGENRRGQVERNIASDPVRTINAPIKKPSVEAGKQPCYRWQGDLEKGDQKQNEDGRHQNEDEEEANIVKFHAHDIWQETELG